LTPVAKMRTHKGLQKRLKVTASGKIKHKRPNTSHLMSGKSGSRVRHLRKMGILQNKPWTKRMREYMGGG